MMNYNVRVMLENVLFSQACGRIEREDLHRAVAASGYKVVRDCDNDHFIVVKDTSDGMLHKLYAA